MGLVLYDTQGRRAGGIFLDAEGTHGMVDSLPVSANGSLIKWLDSFSECLP